MKAQKLRSLFSSDKVIRIVGAHNGMSAFLAEKAGFEGIWASGLEVSTAHAVPDANILTMSDYLQAASNMNDSTTIPVVVDVDTGYGNSNNVIHMVKRFEAAGIAAVSIEDKKFPKVNSYVPGRQELATIAEFVGKVMATKNAQSSSDFMVIARVEALIAGWGQAEALKRAYAYAKAGADGIFIHSKATNGGEIEEFISEWHSPVPLVVCPTTYPDFTVEKAHQTGKVKMYVFANHGIRSAVHSMEKTFATLAQSGDIRTVEKDIAPMKKIFDIQRMPQMKESEKKYLFSGDKVQALIPAAGDDSSVPSFQDLLRDRPLGMLDINGKPILQRTIEMLNNTGIQDVTVVTGYQKNEIKLDGVKLVENDEYHQTGVLHSIMCPRNGLSEKVLMLFSDIVFERNILERLLKRDEDILLVIDRSYREITTNGKKLDLVQATYCPSCGERSVSLEKDNPVLKIGHTMDHHKATHEFIGMALFSKDGFNALKEAYEEIIAKSPAGEFHDATSFATADFTGMMQEMIDRGHKVSSLEINKGWMEIHNFDDYKKACETLKD